MGERLRESEERFRLLVEQVRDYAIFLLDPGGYVVSWNAGAEQIQGYKAEEIIGQHFSRFYPREDVERGKPQAELVEAVRAGRCEDEGWRVRGNGRRFWANVVITALRNDAGTLQGFAKVTRDLTARKRAEEALRKTQQTLQTIFDAAPVAILGVDRAGRITSWNKGAHRMFGWSAEEATGRVCPTVPQKGLRDYHAMIKRVLRRGPQTGMVRYRQKKSGELMQAGLSAAPLQDATGRAPGVMIILEDISERMRAQRTFQEYADRLKALSKQLLQAQEDERRRIARELHDQIGQSLTLLQVKLQAARDQLDPRRIGSVLQESVLLVGGLVEQIRGLCLDLRPSILEDLGLVPALRWHVDRLSQTTGVQIQFEAPANSSPGRWPAEIETACFRLAQEALTNVVRHAQAGSVSVQLYLARSRLVLRLTDDGIGFDVEAARKRALQGLSMGLSSMEERATLVGGDLSITSSPGQGTIVRATFPLAGQ